MADGHCHQAIVGLYYTMLGLTRQSPSDCIGLLMIIAHVI
jgi:hypothetical protein